MADLCVLVSWQLPGFVSGLMERLVTDHLLQVYRRIE